MYWLFKEVNNLNLKMRLKQNKPKRPKELQVHEPITIPAAPFGRFTKMSSMFYYTFDLFRYTINSIYLHVPISTVPCSPNLISHSHQNHIQHLLPHTGSSKASCGPVNPLWQSSILHSTPIHLSMVKRSCWRK